jgi:hypothetical protein
MDTVSIENLPAAKPAEGVAGTPATVGAAKPMVEVMIHHLFIWRTTALHTSRHHDFRSSDQLDKMNQVVPLSEETAAGKDKHQAQLMKFQLEMRARTIAAPTNDQVRALPYYNVMCFAQLIHMLCLG